MQPLQPFAPRAIQWLGVRCAGDWNVKLYAILAGGRPFDETGFDPAIHNALASLPAADPEAYLSRRAGPGSPR